MLAPITPTPGLWPLSGLQRCILALAQFHRLNAARDTGTHPDVYSYEVLAVRWGFPTREGQRLPLWEKRTSHRPHFPKATRPLWAKSHDNSNH